MNKNFRNVLVTGGAGFIGSHLVDRILREGSEVTVFDNFSKGSLKNIAPYLTRKGFHLVKGDIRNFNLVKDTMKEVDAVLHEAAFVSVVLSIEDPILVNDVNVTSTLNLLKASLDSNVKR